GIGGGAVNARYLSRIGMAPGAIAGALGTLAAVGALTDAAYVAGVTTLAPSIGLGGAANELKSLVARGAAGGQQHGWAVASAAAVAIVVMGVRLRGRLIGSSANMLQHAMSHLIAL